MTRRALCLLSCGLFLAACAAESDDLDVTGAAIRSSHAAVCPGPAAPGTARCHARVIVDGKGDPLATSGPSGLHPSDLIDAYKVPTTTASPTIAIVDAYGYASAESDLAVYRQTFGLPPCGSASGCFTKIDQRGGTSYPRDNLGWAQETALDLDMASAICPTCKLLLVEADSATLANLGAAVDTAAGWPGVVAISNSYGGGETGAASADVHYTHPNVTITVSSGDSGYGVEYPASSPHVVAVGGTHLVRASGTRGWSETAWSGAGSGCSAVFAKPSWQTDPDCANRTVADVSAVADPNTGVAVFGPTRRNRSAWMVFGGTSVAAPLVAGVLGVAYNGVAVDAGFLYANALSLFDVTSGSNGSCGGSYLCTAGAGYDGPTGLGTPNGTAAF